MKDFPMIGALAIGVGAATITTRALEDTLGDSTLTVLEVTDSKSIPQFAASSGVVLGAGLYFGVRGLCWAIRKMRSA